MANQLPQINHIVQLMLENRSFDQMLGFLYTNAAPPNVSPAGHPYDGLMGAEFNAQFYPKPPRPQPKPDHHSEERSGAAQAIHTKIGRASCRERV